MNNHNPICKPEMWIALGIFGGMAAIGAAMIAIWNSKQLRAARAMKRANKIMHRIGIVLQGIGEE